MFKGMLNVHPIRIPGRSGVLRFDRSEQRYDARESIAMVALNTGAKLWDKPFLFAVRLEVAAGMARMPALGEAMILDLRQCE